MVRLSKGGQGGLAPLEKRGFGGNPRKRVGGWEKSICERSNAKRANATHPRAPCSQELTRCREVGGLSRRLVSLRFTRLLRFATPADFSGVSPDPPFLGGTSFPQTPFLTRARNPRQVNNQIYTRNLPPPRRLRQTTNRDPITREIRQRTRLLIIKMMVRQKIRVKMRRTKTNIQLLQKTRPRQPVQHIIHRRQRRRAPSPPMKSLSRDMTSRTAVKQIRRQTQTLLGRPQPGAA